MIIGKVKPIRDFSQERILEAIKISCCKVKMEVYNNKLVIPVSLDLKILDKLKIKIEKAIVPSSNNSK